MTDMWNIKEIIQRETVIPNGMKHAISIATAFNIDILVRNENENIISEKRKTKT